MVLAALGRARPYLIAGLLLSAAALVLDYASLRWFGPLGAFIHVRWAPEVPEAEREALERRFCLTAREATEGTTYSYLLVDASTDNIRRLIAHPAVQDTHDLDRSAFAVVATAERALIGDAAAQRASQQTAAAARLLWMSAASLALLALVVAAASAQAARLAGALRAIAQAIARGLYRRIPDVSPEGAALFRIVFGSASVAVFALSPPALYSSVITPWLWMSGVLFVAGVLTRLSFAAFTLGAIAWSVVYTMESGHHPISALLVALLCLLPSRWGDAWSVDALLGRGRNDVASGFSRTTARDYGYTVWIPGVVLGLALAAAAFSKLREAGLNWILNGTVKYHFLTDVANAPVDWGVQLAVVPVVAVALSFVAVAVESLVIVAAILGPWPVRLAAACAVLPMFVGFWLFQGVFWPAWWVLLLSFAPWHRVRGVRRHPSTRARGALSEVEGQPDPPLRWRPVHAAILAAAVAQQIVASTWRLEVPPLFSAYDMYSKTYATPDEYPPTGGTSHWLVASMADDTTSACQIGGDEARMLAALPASEYTRGAREMLASCFGDLRAVRTVTVEESHPQVDWKAGRYLGTSRARLSGPTALMTDEGR